MNRRNRFILSIFLLAFVYPVLSYGISTLTATVEVPVISASNGHFNLNDNHASAVNNLKLIKLEINSDHWNGFDVKMNSANDGRLKQSGAANENGKTLTYQPSVHLDPGMSTQFSGTITTPPFNLNGPEATIIDVSNMTNNMDAVFFLHIGITEQELRSSFSTAGSSNFVDNMTFTITEKP